MHFDLASDHSTLRDGRVDARTLELAGLGQGLMDSAFNTMIARKHQGEESDQTVLGRRRHNAIQRTIDRLGERLTESVPASPDFGVISVGVALAYLEFRLPEYDLAALQPAVHRWYRDIAERDSFRQTAFV